MKSFLKVAVLALTGVAISRLLLSPLRGYEYAGFVLLPGFLLYTIFLFHITFQWINGKFHGVSEWLMCGVVIDSYGYWILRKGTDAAVTIDGPWDQNILLLSLCAYAVFIVLAVTCCVGRIFLAHSLDKMNRLVVYGSVLLVVATIVAFRVSYVLSFDIPNEERSLFIKGCEIHHAVTGSFLVVLAACLGSVSGYFRNIFFPLFALGAAFSLDQFTYLQLDHVSDAAYGGAISFFGAVINGSLYSIYILVVHQISSSDRSYCRRGINVSLK